MDEEMRNDSASGCYEHQRDDGVAGICPFCLNERLLLVLATKRRNRSHGWKPTFSSLPNFFALGTFLRHLRLRHHRKSDGGSDFDAASTGQEDSFISIEIEGDGIASWEKSRVSEVPPRHCNMPRSYSTGSSSDQVNETEPKRVTGHAKTRASLTWRKRIGCLFQIIRWKRSKGGNACHADRKVRKGWMRKLTKRSAKE